VHKWGEKVYVRIEGGTKLGGRVREGKWLRVDEESKTACVYWLDSKTVTVEQNIYYKNPLVNCFEEEELVEIVKTNIDLPVAPNPPVVNDTVPENANPDAPETSDTETTEKFVRKPTKKIADLLQGTGSWSTADRRKLPPGVQQPSTDWTASVSECEDEHAFAAEVSNAEALEPKNLSEAKKQPDWLLWEKAIEDELETLRAAGTWKVVDVRDGVNVVGSKWVSGILPSAGSRLFQHVCTGSVSGLNPYCSHVCSC
jgi:hypothetical protein